MRFLKDENGFSLLEITIAMGLATGLLLFYMKMQGEQTKKALTAKVNQEVENFYTDFKGTINRPGFCNKSFENSTMPDTSATLIQTIKNPRGDIRYQVGEVYGGKTLKLNSIMLKDFKPDDKEGLEGIAIIELDIEKIGNVYGSKKIKKLIEVSISRDANKNIVGCGSIGAGGLNINISVPTAPTTTTPAVSTTVTMPTHQNPTNTTSTVTTPTVTPHTATTPVVITPTVAPQTVTTPATTLPIPDDEHKKAVLIELEKNPEFKKMQESLKKMQQNNEAIEAIGADEDF